MSEVLEGDPRHCAYCRLRSVGINPLDRDQILIGRGRYFIPMRDMEKGGADFSLVTLDARKAKPRCRRHGAMNKVSEIYWRCIATSGAKFNPCRAACEELAT